MITLGDILNIATIVRACQSGSRVMWLNDSGDTITGTARHICRDTVGNFAHGEADPMATFVRITASQGLEIFFPMAELMEKVESGTFVVDPA